MQLKGPKKRFRGGGTIANFVQQGAGRGRFFSARRWKERPEGVSLGAAPARFCSKRCGRAGTARAMRSSEKKPRKGAKTFAKPSPGGQKSSQKGAKTFAKPPPGGPGRVLGPLGAPIEKKDQNKTGVTPKGPSHFGGVFRTFLKK